MFWLTLIAYFITIVLALLVVRSIILNFNTQTAAATKGLTLFPSEVYTFPYVWHNLTFLLKYMKIFMAVIIAIIVTNEFAYNTLRQNMINGLKRSELVISKYLTAFIIAFFASLLILIFGLIAGFLNTKEIVFEEVFSMMYHLASYFYLLMCYLSMVIFLSFVIRKSALVLGVLLIYSYILEPILDFKLDEYARYLPLHSINATIPIPASPLANFVMKRNLAFDAPDWSAFLIAGIYGLLFFYFSLMIIKKRNL